MNNQNRTADGRIASKKEAMRCDCHKMIARYKAEAKAAIQIGRRDIARTLVNKCADLRAAFFADFGEAA
jgi:hypothetical protein